MENEINKKKRKEKQRKRKTKFKRRDRLKNYSAFVGIYTNRIVLFAF